MYKRKYISVEPSKWVITREPTRLIMSLDQVGLKKKIQISIRVKYEPNPLRTRLIRLNP